MIKRTTTLVAIIFFCLSAFAELPELNKNLIENPTDLPASVTTSQQVLVDLDEDGTWDFKVRYYGNAPTYYNFEIGHNSPSGTSGGIIINSTPSDQKQAPSTRVANLNAGTMIGSSPDLGLEWKEGLSFIMQSTTGTAYSSFLDDDNKGYVGLKMPKGYGSQYGWIQVHVDPDATTVSVLGKGVSAKADTPIPAGDAPAVPLTFLATFLGLGIIGIGAARRRKKN